MQPPVNGLLPALLGALRQLRAKKTAGEENKAIRAIYSYIETLAEQGMLTRQDASAIVQQLFTFDVKDDMLPRHVAAFQLGSELIARYSLTEREYRCTQASILPRDRCAVLSC